MRTDWGSAMKRRVLATLLFAAIMLGAGESAAAQHLRTGSPETRRPAPTPVPTPEVSPGWSEIMHQYGVQTVEYPRDGVVVGQGWNSFNARKAPSFCIAGQVREIADVTATQVTFRRIDDVQTLFNSIEATASGNYSGGMYSVSAKVDFARSVRMETQKLNVLASIRIEAGLSVFLPTGPTASQIAFGSFRLTDEARRILRDEGVAQFRRRCGDSFIIAIRSGGELQTFMKFGLSATETKESLFASIRASGFGASGGASFKNLTETTERVTSFEYEFFHSGQSNARNPTSVDDLVARVARFGTPEEQYKPAPYQIYAISYSQIGDLLLSDFLSSNTTEVNRLAAHYFRLIDLARQYADVARNPDAFADEWNFSTLTDMHRIHDQLIQAARIVDAALKICFLEFKCKENDIRTGLLGSLRLPGALERGGRIGSMPDPLTLSLAAVFFGSAHQPDLFRAALRETSARPAPPEPAAAGMDAATRSAAESAAKEIAANELEQQLNSAVEPLAIKEYELYYLHLAMKPLAHSELNFRSLVFQSDNTTVRMDKPPGESNAEFARRNLRTWILRNRLLPVAAEACRRSATDPMCIEIVRLETIVDRVRAEIPEESLRPQPVPTPIKEPSPRPPPRPIPSPCERPNPRLCPI